MAKLLSDLRTGTRTYLDEAAQADWLDTEVDSSINYSYQDVVGKVMEVYEGYYETTNPITIAMVKSQQEYTLDSTLLKVTRVEINYQPAVSGSTPARAVRSSMDEVLLQLNNSAAQGSFFNAGYYIHGSQDTQTIGFIPIPSNSDTTGKSISVWGIQSPATLVAATDTVRIPYPERFAQLIELNAAARLLRKGQQAETVAARYMAEYKEGIMEMQTYLKERQQDGVWGIEESEIDNLDFQESLPW